MSAASPVTTGNATRTPVNRRGFLLGDPTTTCCGFVNHSLSRGAPYLIAHRGGAPSERSITEPQQGQDRRTGLKEATVTSPIDSHSIWHSIRLTDIDFESLNWGQIDPPVAEKSCDKYSPDSEGGLSHI